MTYEPSPQDEAKLQAAQKLIEQENYVAAKAILDTMPNNPQAQNWLDTIAQLMPEGEKPKRGDADPYGQDEFYEGEPRKRKRASKSAHYEDSVAKAGIVLIVCLLIMGLGSGIFPIACIASWIVGSALTIAFLIRAWNAERHGREVKGVGCLWSMFIVEGLILCAAALFFMWFISMWTGGMD